MCLPVHQLHFRLTVWTYPSAMEQGLMDCEEKGLLALARSVTVDCVKQELCLLGHGQSYENGALRLLYILEF
jgi:hypothetical protein